MCHFEIVVILEYGTSDMRWGMSEAEIRNKWTEIWNERSRDGDRDIHLTRYEDLVNLGGERSMWEGGGEADEEWEGLMWDWEWVKLDGERLVWDGKFQSATPQLY